MVVASHDNVRTLRNCEVLFLLFPGVGCNAGTLPAVFVSVDGTNKSTANAVKAEEHGGVMCSRCWIRMLTQIRDHNRLQDG